LGLVFAPISGIGQVRVGTIPAVSNTTENNNVLILYDEQDELPGLAVLDQSLRSVLASTSSFKVDVGSPENIEIRLLFSVPVISRVSWV
jgi:hypothetical protein